MKPVFASKTTNKDLILYVDYEIKGEGSYAE